MGGNAIDAGLGSLAMQWATTPILTHPTGLGIFNISINDQVKVLECLPTIPFD